MKRNLVVLGADVGSRSLLWASSRSGGLSSGMSGVMVRSRAYALGASSSTFESGGLMEERIRRRLGERGDSIVRLSRAQTENLEIVKQQRVRAWLLLTE